MEKVRFALLLLGHQNKTADTLPVGYDIPKRHRRVAGLNQNIGKS
jgi:hypothetical protein